MKQPLFQKIYLVAFLILMYIPMLLVIVYSFNESNLATIWTGFSLRWYKKLMHNRDIMAALKNSLILATVCSAFSMLIGTLGAVTLDKYKNKLNRAVGILAAVPLMLPEIITGLVFLIMFSLLGIRLGMMTLILAHSSFCIPYVFMTVNSSLSMLSPDTEDAARDLGATPGRTFFEITVPQLLPGIIGGGLLAFAMSMDDVVISFFVTGPQTNTLPVKIYSQMKMGVTPEVNALCTLMLAFTVLIIILFFALKRKKGTVYKVSPQSVDG